MAKPIDHSQVRSMLSIRKAFFIPLLILLFASMFPSISHAFEPSQQREEQLQIYIDLWRNELFLLNQQQIVAKYKIAPGKNETPTPVGHFKVTSKAKDWGTGFGTRWLGLDVPWGTYGIHGTNKPNLIGQNVSAGCVRMRNRDVEQLYELVPVGTPVHIDGPLTGMNEVNQFPILACGSRGSLVQLVQNRLQAAGYYQGECDGIYGKYTEMAVKEFQRNQKLPVTGYLTERDFIRLGLVE